MPSYTWRRQEPAGRAGRSWAVTGRPTYGHNASARTVFGVHLARDRAVSHVDPVPQAEVLPGAEERARLVVDHGDRHLGAIAGVQRFLVVPADLGGEAPGIAGLVQALRPDHEGVSVI